MTGLVDIGGDQWVNPTHVTAVYRQPGGDETTACLGDTVYLETDLPVADVVARLNGSFVPDPQATETAGEDARRDSPAETLDGQPPRLPEGPSLEDTDRSLIGTLRALADSYGASGVALTVHQLWPSVWALPSTVDAIDYDEAFLGGAV